MKRKPKAELLADYARKPVQRFAQIDVHINQKDWDDLIRPDEEGDGITAAVSYDLANTECVRVRFPDGTPAADVARALRKALAWIERADLWEPIPERGNIAFFGKSEPVDWKANESSNAGAALIEAESILAEQDVHNKLDDVMRRGFSGGRCAECNKSLNQPADAIWPGVQYYVCKTCGRPITI